MRSREMGNQRIYFFNPRLYFKNELKALLEKYIEVDMSPEKDKDFYLIRRRSRTRSKPRI